MARIAIPLPWSTVYGNSDSVYINHPAAAFRSASEVRLARATLEIRGITNASYTLTVTAGVELADHADTIAAVASVGSGFTSNGVHYPTGWTDLSTYTEDAQLIRPVLQCLCSGAGLEFARVGGLLEFITR
jgi:hypothetical protein